MIRLLLAGGGSGGHLFPAVAVAEEFQGQEPGTEVLFVVTGRPVEEAVLSPRGFASRRIAAGGLMGKSLSERLVSLGKLPVGLYQSAAIIRSFRPDLVFCVGGYAAGPVGVAARLMGRPLAVHEQNSVPGMTNRRLGRLADLVFISFASSREFFPAGKVHLTGNPIRREIAAKARDAGPRAGDGFHLLVVGGSQGAHAVNEAVLEAMGRLAAEVGGLSVKHQTGASDLARARAVYREHKVEAEVSDFIQDMVGAYLWADLVVARR
jgi:UDP-N-acetylglucosamine--N-acetylmuramyl-(pentapeptide) pyrophosphoryl-undecaprenol N-acetylglucosamine transferase